MTLWLFPSLCNLSPPCHKPRPPYMDTAREREQVVWGGVGERGHTSQGLPPSSQADTCWGAPCMGFSCREHTAGTPDFHLIRHSSLGLLLASKSRERGPWFPWKGGGSNSTGSKPREKQTKKPRNTLSWVHHAEGKWVALVDGTRFHCQCGCPQWVFTQVPPASAVGPAGLWLGRRGREESGPRCQRQCHGPHGGSPLLQ